MFVDQQLSEEARIRAETAAAAANAKRVADARQTPMAEHLGPLPDDSGIGPLERIPLRDTELVPTRPDLDMALEAARQQRAQEEDARAIETLNPHTPTFTGWRRWWSITKLCMAVLTVFPIRIAIIIVAFVLLSLAATAVILAGCLSCRCSSSTSLSAKPPNGMQRVFLRLMSPLCRLLLFSLGFIYIREHRVENDFHTRRLRKRCWQCRPSRQAQSAAAGAAAIATAAASRSGSNFRPGASTSTPQRHGIEMRSTADRQRIDAVVAAHGSTIIANHSSIADVLYLGWRYPVTAVASDFFKLIPCCWLIASSIGILFLSGHRAMIGKRTGMRATERIMQYQNAAATKQGHHLRRLVVFPEGTTTNGRQLLQFRYEPALITYLLKTTPPVLFKDHSLQCVAACHRTGAFVAGLPVQPVLITYRWRARNPHLTGSYTSSVLELTTSWYNVMEVKELPVHFPTTKEQADPREFADNMQDLMAKGDPT